MTTSLTVPQKASTCVFKCCCILPLLTVLSLASIGVMDELKCCRISRRGYHSHTTKLLSEIPALLSIPIFSGDLLTWQSFWDCFDSAVNSNTTLSDVQKLSYLRAQLQGDASRVVAGFSLTNTSYKESVTYCLIKNNHRN